MYLQVTIFFRISNSEIFRHFSNAPYQVIFNITLKKTGIIGGTSCRFRGGDTVKSVYIHAGSFNRRLILKKGN
jgi:hypothetical protein